VHACNYTRTYRDDVLGVLDWCEEERAVNERVSIKDQQHLLTQNAGGPRYSLGRKGGKDESSGLIIAMIAIILHL